MNRKCEEKYNNTISSPAVRLDALMNIEIEIGVTMRVKGQDSHLKGAVITPLNAKRAKGRPRNRNIPFSRL